MGGAGSCHGPGAQTCVRRADPLHEAARGSSCPAEGIMKKDRDDDMAKVHAALSRTGHAGIPGRRAGGSPRPAGTVERTQETNDRPLLDHQLWRESVRDRARTADSFTVALARRSGGAVMTGDPEFKSVESVIAIHWLPPRRGFRSGSAITASGSARAECATATGRPAARGPFRLRDAALERKGREGR
jgi:hypothetical protein